MPAEPVYVERMPSSAHMTADELWNVHIPHKRVELVRGVLRVRAPGYGHGLVTALLAAELVSHARAHNLGGVLAGDVGFKIAANPDTVRGPDVAFVRRDREPDPGARAFPALAPDLVIEVLSPNDRPGEILAKVGDWLSGGSSLCWVVDPRRRIARVYRADGSESLVEADGALDGEDVLPGFSCPLASIL
jgi:Uma2 family endonuclease